VLAVRFSDPLRMDRCRGSVAALKLALPELRHESAEWADSEAK
jgi:hypothetical protein